MLPCPTVLPRFHLRRPMRLRRPNPRRRPRARIRSLRVRCLRVSGALHSLHLRQSPRMSLRPAPWTRPISSDRSAFRSRTLKKSVSFCSKGVDGDSSTPFFVLAGGGCARRFRAADASVRVIVLVFLPIYMRIRLRCFSAHVEKPQEKKENRHGYESNDAPGAENAGRAC